MSGLIPIVLLGALILVLSGRLLVQWSTQNRTREGTIDAYSQARAALDSSFAETAAIKRIFANEDMEFISEAGTRDVQRLFLKERKGLALRWVRMTQKQVAHLMDLHLKLASYTDVPSLRFEFKLTVNYFWFIFASNTLLAFLWFGGPFEAARAGIYTLRVAEYFWSMVSLRLEEIERMTLSSTYESRMV